MRYRSIPRLHVHGATQEASHTTCHPELSNDLKRPSSKTQTPATQAKAGAPGRPATSEWTRASHLDHSKGLKLAFGCSMSSAELRAAQRRAQPPREALRSGGPCNACARPVDTSYARRFVCVCVCLCVRGCVCVCLSVHTDALVTSKGWIQIFRPSKGKPLPRTWSVCVCAC